MNDDGFTFLPGGVRLSKSDGRMDALGALDELDAALGLLRVSLAGKPDAGLVETVQRDLLRIGGELATGRPALEAAAVAALDGEIARRNAALPVLREFVVAGANEASARAHVARAVCRRAERELVRAREAHPGIVFSPALAYLNRLSGLLFALARAAENPDFT
ncbi:MAG: cob(I)yrinic acid a,c-diamide adenosyltransferase [Kiritimatiellia bacterium]